MAESTVKWTPARWEVKWVTTRNERNFVVVMDLVARTAGEGRLVELTGAAGRGKTTTVRRMAANSNPRWPYLLCLEVWKRSEKAMLQALCKELGIVRPPEHTSSAFAAAAERLSANPVPVFLDEMDLLPNRINLVRQLSEVSSAPFVLIGEESLSDAMARYGRVTSRTIQALEFAPVSAAEIIVYGRETSGLEIPSEAAQVLHASPGGGDWRIIRNLTLDLVEIANAHQTRTVSADMARQAVGMRPKTRGRGGRS